MRRPFKSIFFIPFISLIITFSVTTHAEDSKASGSVAKEIIEHMIAYNAKLLCSGIFVVGREKDEFIKNDLLRFPCFSWDDIEVTVDQKRKSVTLTIEGIPQRTAVYNGDQGCTLLPRGIEDVYFKSVAIPKPIPDPARQKWPMGDVLDDKPLPSEVDAAALKSAVDSAFDDRVQNFWQKTRALVVVYNGQIIAERYATGFDKNIRQVSYSMAKSITTALIGVLVREGHFHVDDPAPIAEWRDPKDPRNEITISHLLRMSSGLAFHRGNLIDGTLFTNKHNHGYVYFGAPNVFKYSINNELKSPPGMVWRYRNCDPLALGKIIRDAVEAKGEGYLSFPHRALLNRIGMSNMVLEPDPWGNFIMCAYAYGTARDWARFGLLHLQDGVWQGERILPEGWVNYIIKPAPAKKDRGYGALFWLNAGGKYPALPRDMYWPLGFGGQVCMIIPSRDMVIVRLGKSPLGGVGFDQYIEMVIQKILASVRKP